MFIHMGAHSQSPLSPSSHTPRGKCVCVCVCVCVCGRCGVCVCARRVREIHCVCLCVGAVCAEWVSAMLQSYTVCVCVCVCWVNVAVFGLLTIFWHLPCTPLQ